MLVLFEEFGYIGCPHTAIAWLGARSYAKENPGQYASVFLSTAHPCKFPDAIAADVFGKIVLPVGAETLQGKEKLAEPLKVDFEAFKKYIINHN